MYFDLTFWPTYAKRSKYYGLCACARVKNAHTSRSKISSSAFSSFLRELLSDLSVEKRSNRLSELKATKTFDKDKGNSNFIYARAYHCMYNE